MTSVMVIESGTSFPNLPGHSVVRMSVEEFPLGELPGTRNALLRARRKSALKRGARTFEAMIDKHQPAVIVVAHIGLMPYVDASKHDKILVIAKPVLTKQGTVQDSWRYREWLSDLEGVIVSSPGEQEALLSEGLNNVRCISGSPESWAEEIRQALR